MPSPIEIKSLVDTLHNAKVINADLPAHQLVATVSEGITNPAQLAGWYVIAGDHYVVVAGAPVGGIAEVTNPAQRLG